MGISVDSIVLVDSSASSVILALPCQSVLGWIKEDSNPPSSAGVQNQCQIRLFYHRGECVLLRPRNSADRAAILRRLAAATPGAEVRVASLRRRPRSATLGLSVRGADGVVTDVAAGGPGWTAGLARGWRLVEVCTANVASLGPAALTDLLATTARPLVGAVPPLSDGTPRIGCHLPACAVLRSCVHPAHYQPSGGLPPSPAVPPPPPHSHPPSSESSDGGRSSRGATPPPRGLNSPTRGGSNPNLNRATLSGGAPRGTPSPLSVTPQTVTARPATVVASVEQMWSSLVHTATQAQLESATHRPPRRTSPAESVGGSRPQSQRSSPATSIGGGTVTPSLVESGTATPPPPPPISSSNSTNVSQLQERVAQLEVALAAEQRRCAQLKAENVQLQEDSRAAAHQLHQFTEWFFNTIDNN